jgi:hypothetical protein
MYKLEKSSSLLESVHFESKMFLVQVPQWWNSLKLIMVILCRTTFWTKNKKKLNMSVKCECYFIWDRSMNNFNLIKALMSSAFLITLYLYICVLIMLMLVNWYV